MQKKSDRAGARKRTRKPGRLADLPTKPVKGKDAAAVKGRMAKIAPTIIDSVARRLPGEWVLSSSPTRIREG